MTEDSPTVETMVSASSESECNLTGEAYISSLVGHIGVAGKGLTCSIRLGQEPLQQCLESLESVHVVQTREIRRMAQNPSKQASK